MGDVKERERPAMGALRGNDPAEGTSRCTGPAAAASLAVVPGARNKG